MRGRLDKLVAAAFQLSRSQARDAIREGRVSVDGLPCRDPAAQADGDACQISLDGAAVRPREHFYLMMYKPEGVLSATRDSRQETALDLLPAWYRRGGIVGRLDKDAQGLLLITDDGELNHRLTAPRSRISKTYLVHTDLPVGPEVAEAFSRGIDLGDFVTMPAGLELLDPGGTRCHVTIEEGKFHQIKRMFAAHGIHVTFLKRLAIGPLTLDPGLAPGQYRPLETMEIQAIQERISNLTKKDHKKS